MKYHAALAHFPKITYARYRKLAAYFSDLKNLWDAEFTELVQTGLEEEIAHEFLSWREHNPVEQLLERLELARVKTVSLDEPEYPALLKEINDPPHTLFIRGNFSNDAKPALGVVGTRKMSNYGKLACQEIVAPLARQRIKIISGLALGIDGVAHQTALENDGVTIAVLGGGVDKTTVHPTSHQFLAEKIIEKGGAVISEYPPGFQPMPYTFPARNRIIAGLSLGTLVVEAPEQSGALITAKFALDYNREIFAIPHPINTANGVGCNNLLKLGARLVSSATDIFETLSLGGFDQLAINIGPKPASSTEAVILSLVSKEPKHIDSIIKESGLESPTVNSAITMMEIKGMIRNLGGMNYIVR
ncbi:MAG: DNA-processing protein DprA [Patescibacteria group bacterium]